MGFHYGYYGNQDMFEEFMPMFAILGSVILVAAIVGLLARLVIWVFRSLALYTIGRRRGLKNPWLAWVPVGQEWIIGSVSDQYQYLTQGKNQNRRKILLILKLAAVVIGLVAGVVGIFNVMRPIAMYGGYSGEETIRMMMPMTGSMLLSVVSAGIGIVAFVFRQISMYDLYRSCEPKNAIPYLVFGILFGVLEPVFLMILRNRDEGMPPRKTAPEEPANDYL